MGLVDAVADVRREHVAAILADAPRQRTVAATGVEHQLVTHVVGRQVDLPQEKLTTLFQGVVPRTTVLMIEMGPFPAKTRGDLAGDSRGFLRLFRLIGIGAFDIFRTQPGNPVANRKDMAVLAHELPLDDVLFALVLHHFAAEQPKFRAVNRTDDPLGNDVSHGSALSRKGSRVGRRTEKRPGLRNHRLEIDTPQERNRLGGGWWLVASG